MLSRTSSKREGRKLGRLTRNSQKTDQFPEKEGKKRNRREKKTSKGKAFLGRKTPGRRGGGTRKRCITERGIDIREKRLQNKGWTRLPVNEIQHSRGEEKEGPHGSERVKLAGGKKTTRRRKGGKGLSGGGPKKKPSDTRGAVVKKKNTPVFQWLEGTNARGTLIQRLVLRRKGRSKIKKTSRGDIAKGGERGEKGERNCFSSEEWEGTSCYKLVSGSREASGRMRLRILLRSGAGRGGSRRCLHFREEAARAGQIYAPGGKDTRPQVWRQRNNHAVTGGGWTGQRVG